LHGKNVPTPTKAAVLGLSAFRAGQCCVARAILQRSVAILPIGVTLRMPIELNDWLDDLLKQGKRKHGQKIPKEVSV
jgi:hypothetical protein